uniref:(northern house mosquito) hypothetical protein n=1 Tax=Culex pipiens TaxID=7175 RepID=A0A8D8CD03_CULPI
MILQLRPHCRSSQTLVFFCWLVEQQHGHRSIVQQQLNEYKGLRQQRPRGASVCVLYATLPPVTLLLETSWSFTPIALTRSGAAELTSWGICNLLANDRLDRLAHLPAERLLVAFRSHPRQPQSSLQRYSGKGISPGSSRATFAVPQSDSCQS